ncbi:MAG: UDP-glucose/GDP-mannose dehydrogenase family protein [Spirochaetales bacterium]|nr:UDP-glucose/GDP-mannose dehydrogenase family protein [Spirochaetales bacterium]
MNISVIGTGYVGLVGGVVLSEFGHNVICVDIDAEKVKKINLGKSPIYEPGLSELLIKNLNAKRFSATTDIEFAIRQAEVIFIAVGTPPQEDGSADLQYVFNVAKSIGRYMNEYKVIVDKSTVPIGTGQSVKNIIKDELKKREIYISFDVVSNPEFLREGKAVFDFMHPDRIVIGFESDFSKEKMKEVYQGLYINKTPFLFCNIETAELVKYASNAFLATKISFINELAILSESVGANIKDVATGMGMDGRISPKFLHAGPGYGGSCFPKDTKALYDIGMKNNLELLVVKSAMDANENQKKYVFEKIKRELGLLKNLKVGVLGLSFKPDTDDLRDAPSLYLVPRLIDEGAVVKVFCPEGMSEARWRFEELNSSITYCENEYEVAIDSDALVILTEWNQFRIMDMKKIRSLMKGNFLFDLRNIYTDNKDVRALFKYFGVGV